MSKFKLGSHFSNALYNESWKQAYEVLETAREISKLSTTYNERRFKSAELYYRISQAIRE